ncbi:hypothetical protein AVEN_112713-1 [Araneus ventricosus]|uniref:Uncharacterized protein n=1 Tax=Araneus ventricosus TaxID=182803 RepID=A0A4Y2Q1N6_ARAVE|nr:hypothetical protein AVEN_112713-1 [Araneus ventricosus]
MVGRSPLAFISALKRCGMNPASFILLLLFRGNVASNTRNDPLWLDLVINIIYIELTTDFFPLMFYGDYVGRLGWTIKWLVVRVSLWRQGKAWEFTGSLSC